MQITYQLSANAWDGYPVEVRRLIEHHHSIRLCDIGGGANPILPLDYIARYRLQYTLLDISRAELDKAPPGYRTVLADICDPAVTESGPYDFVFSGRWRNIYETPKSFMPISLICSRRGA